MIPLSKLRWLAGVKNQKKVSWTQFLYSSRNRRAEIPFSMPKIKKNLERLKTDLSRLKIKTGQQKTMLLAKDDMDKFMVNDSNY